MKNNQYGEVALLATSLIIEKKLWENQLSEGLLEKYNECNKEGKPFDPRTAWEKAAKIIIRSENSQKKGCPRSAFIGLCERGYIKGVPVGNYSKRGSEKNTKYAILAAKYLNKNSEPFNISNTCLWSEIPEPKRPRHEGVMDVVLALKEKKFLKENP